MTCFDYSQGDWECITYLLWITFQSKNLTKIFGGILENRWFHKWYNGLALILLWIGNDVYTKTWKPGAISGDVTKLKVLTSGWMLSPYSRPAWIMLFLLRDHPYITSAHFWTFSDPPTMSALSINTVLNVRKTGHFLDLPTQFFFWPHIWMVPICSRWITYPKIYKIRYLAC